MVPVASAAALTAAPQHSSAATSSPVRLVSRDRLTHSRAATAAAPSPIRLASRDRLAHSLAAPPVTLPKGRKSLGRRNWVIVAILLAVLVPFARPSWAVVSLIATLSEGYNLDDDDAHTRVLLGPFPIAHGGHAVLERHPAHNLPRMRIVAGSRFDEAAVRDTQAFMTRVLKLRRPFSVEWDPRRISWPTFSPGMMRAVKEWVEVHVRSWDERVQGHAVIVSNPIARSFTRWLITLFLPPQPVGIVRDSASAHDFAETCCPKVRSYVKTTYADREVRFAEGAKRAPGGSSSQPGRAPAGWPATAAQPAVGVPGATVAARSLTAALLEYGPAAEAARDLALACP